MSRSYKKKGYGSYVCYKSDKWCRNQYYRQRRRKDKTLCESLKSECDEDYINEDDFVSENIDRSLRFANKCCWASDGGNFFMDDTSTLRKKFDEDVFGANSTIWEDYKKNVKVVFNKDKREYRIKLKKEVFDLSSLDGVTEINKYITTFDYPPKMTFSDGWKIDSWWKIRNPYFRFSSWHLIGFLFKSGIIPLTFESKEELISWLRENEEEILEKWLKASLLRK